MDNKTDHIFKDCKYCPEALLEFNSIGIAHIALDIAHNNLLPKISSY
jgi:hypothetical protein